MQLEEMGKFADKSLVGIQVYFRDIQVLETSQRTAFTWLALFADIGGCLGLVLGGCVLTIAQLVEVFYFSCAEWGRAKKRRRRRGGDGEKYGEEDMTHL